MRLSREIRAYLGDAPCDGAARNTWAGFPAGRWGDVFVCLRAVVEGPVDPRTGFLCNIKLIDDLLMGSLPLLRPGEPRHAAEFDLTDGLPAAAARVAGGLPSPLMLHALAAATSPHTRWTLLTSEPDMIRLTQAFEFSASHRLACPSFSEAQNREVFGKCANTNGHGHNYVLEVTVAGRLDEPTGCAAATDRLNAIVRREVIDAFDHKHLNLDCPDFADLNPTVENIARVIYRRLVGALGGGRIASVKVWETPKTWAEYDGKDEPAPSPRTGC
ncbi:MAG: 6-carboxytetrahydropterin synthase [Phycisphaerales bacterium]|nr:6-carboxytetrahydropterin synthase [Phycisphaerales bacterium]